MKKAVRLILLLLMVFSLVFPACAETDPEDPDFFFNMEDLEEDDYDPAYDAYLKAFLEAFSNYCRMENGTLTLLEGVVTLGDYYGEPTEGGTEPDPEIQALFDGNPGKDLFFSDEFDDDVNDLRVSSVIWPSSIRRIGSYSFSYQHFDTLTLPAGLEKIYPDAFIRCSFDTLRIECALPIEQIWQAMDECGVHAYEVPEDHPLYKAVDGVLYSKDGKTLLDYPAGRKDEHFDVPAGVERIAKSAISSEYLKTISFPIGLKELEDYALYGCTRLQSVALPLTVTRIGTHAFYECISLERVSLPAGLEADKDDSWCVYYPDDSLFRGDNGDTIGGPADQDDTRWSAYRESNLAWLKDAETVPVYETQDSTEPVSAISGDTPLRTLEIYTDRSLVKHFETEDEIGWVDTPSLDFFVDNALFYMTVKPSEAVSVVYGSSEDDYDDYFDTVSGPWIYHDPAQKYIPLSEMILTRDPDPRYGSEELGITTDHNPLEILPLLDAPDGTALTKLHVGTQVRILEEKDFWLRVSTGYDEGWIKKEAVRIVPVHSDAKEE